MATLIGDVFTDSSRFHTMIGGPGISHQHQHQHQQSQDPHFQPPSTRSRDREVNPPHPRQASSPRRQAPDSAATAARFPSNTRRDWEDPLVGVSASGTATATVTEPQPNHPSPSGGASRFPSPPSSSSPSETPSGDTRPQHGTPGCSMATAVHDPVAPGSSSVSISSTSSTSTATTVIPANPRPIPSPDSDSGPPWNSRRDEHPLLTIPTSIPPDAQAGSPVETQTTIRVRDLAHIQGLARADLLTPSGPSVLNDPPLQQMKYEISGMPIGDIIEMVAALLTKITTTNDTQHDALNRNAAHVRQAQAQARNEDGSGEGNMSPLSSSVLAFHGKNVPAITILSYLSRIHKYCPTTYEVFLSLLVYFDRMTERVNDMVTKSEEARRLQMEAAQTRTSFSQAQFAGRVDPRPAVPDTVMRDDDSEQSDETDSDLADDDEVGRGRRRESSGITIQAAPALNANIDTATTQATYFVVDSFNIHRLIIAGVTCASKFFSDVFYTNSRYAKVGGLPLAELNHLELQFLLLNDFRLAVPVEDLEAYATMLVEFYAREVVARPTAGLE
ncbi:cyclin-domain-containing protein [Podospora didyma]|uniref:Cyclin-domain-containing protein n=1 Tax=Podospora didyma TaxID=330526 RepID=A0AAE0NNR7_9PEZI|nr:cyclin-domain-containing protein [Podospora didyma]